MDSRERINLTLNHQEPDRIPFDLGGTFTSGIHRSAYKNLCEYLGIPIPQEDQFLCLDEQIVFIDEDVKTRLGIDTEPVLPGNPANWNFTLEERDGAQFYVNEWQMGLKKPKQDGFYFDVVDHPLENAVLSDLKEFPWPDPNDMARYAGLEENINIARESGRAVIMNSMAPGIMEISAWLLGYERLFTSMLLEPAFIQTLFDKILEIKSRYWEIVLNKVGNQIDVVVESDDLGEQRQLLISPRLYRKIVKPRHKQLYETIHTHTNAKLFLHSCGAIYDIIPDLIEVGVDILNPVQINAPNMDSAKLKKEFGQDLVFWGGAVDPQGVFNSGTPQQVRDDTRRNLENLARSGGFVFAAVHNIQPNVPPENIMAMWEVLQEFGGYQD